MRTLFWPRFTLCLSLTACLVPAAQLVAQENPQSGRLQHVDTMTRDDLRSVCCVNLSPDGKHLYAAAWQANCVSVYRCDAETGRLEHLQSLVSDQDLQGVTSVRISSDGRHAVAAAFRSRTLVLFERDPMSGKLTIRDVVRGDEQPDLGLRWPIDAVLSPDGRFVYLLDPQQSGAGVNPMAQGGIAVFRLADGGKLELVEVNSGDGSSFFGCRGMDFTPDGKLGFVACTNSWQLVVVDRDRETGKLKVRQVVKDGVGEAQALEGVIGVACSGDGRFVYASSGRFSGDNAVSVFRLTDENELELLQEIVNDAGELQNFVGGNEIIVSPDGLTVYAAATRSGALANFRRDAGSGRLTLVETLVHENFAGKIAGAASSEVSPNGKFVYVAAEFAESIEILKRQ
jgi:6-phosphogluconolactonase (cycloisomerase 2 family)